MQSSCLLQYHSAGTSLADAFSKVESLFLTLFLLVFAFVFSCLPVGRSTSLLHKPVLSVFSSLIVLRVTWIPLAEFRLCHCIILTLFFLAAGLIFLALWLGHLCRRVHLQLHTPFPVLCTLRSPLQIQIAKYLFCNPFLACSQWLTQFIFPSNFHPSVLILD